MTDKFAVSVDASGLSSGIAAAGAEFQRVAETEIAPAAKLIEDAFVSVARSIEHNLSAAARRGSLSLKSLARSIVSDLKNLAIDTLVRKPVETFLTKALTGAFGGGRAAGGFVAPGARYLVGERGPEIFTPSVSGRIDGAESRAVTVNIALPGVRSPEDFRQSEAQIAAAMARALGKGRRNL